jgi:hypothetical protein
MYIMSPFFLLVTLSSGVVFGALAYGYWTSGLTGWNKL